MDTKLDNRCRHQGARASLLAPGAMRPALGCARSTSKPVRLPILHARSFGIIEEYGRQYTRVVLLRWTDLRDFPLWHFEAGTIWKASPMTYKVEGRQYVTIAGGANILTFALPED